MKIYLILILLVLGCRSKNHTVQNVTPDQWPGNEGGLVTVKHDGCDWVLWHNNAGSDMEHHPFCTNPKH